MAVLQLFPADHEFRPQFLLALVRQLGFLLAVTMMACGRAPERASDADSPGTSTAQAATASGSPVFPIHISGTGFSDATKMPFPWRGVTAFRLAEMIAGGREEEAVAYLDWAASEELTVVRVLLMAQHLFVLTPVAGRAALPRLLDLAKARGLAVEIVALADTAGLQIDYDGHLREVGRTAAEKGNGFVEIANEPGHPTQDRKLHDPAFAGRLAALLPVDLLVALGSVEYGEGFAAGEYATVHFPRGSAPWDHVMTLGTGALRVAQLRKPVISDEPMGAGPAYQPGRRDNEPGRFAAAAALTRLAGMGATFHYEGGLHARIPQGNEAACLAAWRSGLALVPDATGPSEFLEGEAVGRIARIEGARAAFARLSGDEVTMLVVDATPSLSVAWGGGWREERRASVPGVVVATAARARSGP